MSHLLIPSPDGIDRELRRIVVDPDADPAAVGADVVDAIGDHLAKDPVLEVVIVDLQRFPFGPVIAAGILEIADQFLTPWYRPRSPAVPPPETL